MATERAATVEDAIVLAATAHRGQRYSSPEGEPYVLHPLRMMLRFVDEPARMTAVLHDVIEDTNVSIQDLREAGYPAVVVSAVDALTRRDGESYSTYIDRVAGDPLAARVKRADLAENLANNERNPESPGNAERIARYRTAVARLAKQRSPRQLTEVERHAVLALERPAHIATIDSAGFPQITPIWFVWDGFAFVMTSLPDRPHVRRLRSNPAVGICIDSEDPERDDGERPNRQVRGVGRATLEADVDGDWTRRISERYLHGPGVAARSNERSGRPRVVIRIVPEELVAIASI